MPGQGIGIGIVQRAPTDAARNNILPIEKRKYGARRRHFSAENVKTRERAHMFAVLHAMGLVRGTIRRQCTTTLRIGRATVLCASSAVVNLISFHRDHGPESLKEVRSTNDHSMIKRVLIGIRALLRRGVDVAIAEDGQESNSKDTMKARTMARQKGNKACRSRRQAQLNAWIQIQAVSNQTEVDAA